MCQQFHAACDWADDIIAFTGLSPKNLAVLEMKAQGKGVKEILAVLERRNAKTVTNHMERVCRKLGVTSDSEAIAKARSLGLLRKIDQQTQAEMSKYFNGWL